MCYITYVLYYFMCYITLCVILLMCYITYVSYYLYVILLMCYITYVLYYFMLYYYADTLCGGLYNCSYACINETTGECGCPRTQMLDPADNQTCICE